MITASATRLDGPAVPPRGGTRPRAFGWQVFRPITAFCRTSAFVVLGASFRQVATAMPVSLAMKNNVMRVIDAASAATRGTRPRKLVLVASSLIALLAIVIEATASPLRELSAAQKRELQEQFQIVLQKRKGPFGRNVCVCSDGRKEPVLRPDGTIQNVCGDKTLFCSAFRAPWAEALGRQGVYIGNLFSNDLFLWDGFRDHHDLVRGYILENYFIENHPDHRLAVAKALRGVSGSEYEAPALPRFVERYLGQDGFRDSRHFLLAYELQKRFFVSEDQGRINKVRNLATQIEKMEPKFKPLRDATHNRISASLIPRLTAYRERVPKGKVRTEIDALIAEIEKLTLLDETALRPQLARIEDSALRARLKALMPAKDADRLGVIASLSELMVLARKEVAKGAIAPTDARRLVDLGVTAAVVIQSRGSAYLEGEESHTVKAHIQLLVALTNASYGAGLLTERERKAGTDNLAALADKPRVSVVELTKTLNQATRIIGWAQESALLAFAEVWDAWILLLPEVASIVDDILREKQQR